MSTCWQHGRDTDKTPADTSTNQLPSEPNHHAYKHTSLHLDTELQDTTRPSTSGTSKQL